VMRVLLEKYVHDFISKDNDTMVRSAVEAGVARRRKKVAEREAKASDV
jgi:hypothetical protein